MLLKRNFSVPADNENFWSGRSDFQGLQEIHKALAEGTGTCGVLLRKRTGLIH
jgi:hypothetical protein